jgi:hypothetical protein
MTKAEFISKFRDIDPTSLTFQEQSWEYPNSSAVVHMLAPLRLQFELELQPTGIEVKPHRWVLVGVHP